MCLTEKRSEPKMTRPDLTPKVNDSNKQFKNNDFYRLQPKKSSSKKNLVHIPKKGPSQKFYAISSILRKKK